MPNFISQIVVIMENAPRKVEQPLLKSSSEMDELRCITNSLSSHQNYRDKLTNFPSHEF